MTERLQKFLSRAGVASRRAAERLIEEGRVVVNGAPAHLGLSVDPEADAVRVDGKRIRPPSGGHLAYMLHKPRGTVTTLSDPEGRPTVRDLLKGVPGRVYPVGRLDFHTEGLLLFTDDGDLARDLMHPRSKVEKTYLAKVRGVPTPDALARAARGVVLDGRRTQPARLRLVRQTGGQGYVEVVVTEGRTHLVRRLLEAVGHPVMRLRRVGYGGLELGKLPVGGLRALTPTEVGRLRTAVRRGTGVHASR